MSTLKSEEFRWRKLSGIQPAAWTTHVTGDAQTATAEPSPAPADEVPDIAAERAAAVAQGYDEGLAAGQAEAAQQLARLSALCDEASATLARLQTTVVEEAVQLLPELFRVTLNHELANATLFEHLAEKLRDALPDTPASFQLTLSEPDFAQLNDVERSALGVALRVDPTLPSGVYRASTGSHLVELDFPGALREVLLSAGDTLSTVNNVSSQPVESP